MLTKLLEKMKHSEYLKMEKHPFVIWIGSAVVMTMLLEILSRKSILDAFIFALDKPVIFIINVLIIMAPFSFILLTKRAWFVYGLVSCVLLLIGVIDFILLLFRTTPFNAQDTKQISSALRIMEHYVSWFAIVIAALGVLALLAALAIWWKKAPLYRGKICWKRNILASVLSFATAIFLFSGVVKTTMLPDRFSNIGKAYQDYGLIYCFVSSMVNTGIDQPKDYSPEKMDEILNEDIVPQKQEEVISVIQNEVEEETEPVTEAEKEVSVQLGEQAGAANVIFLQLESFYDVTMLTNVELSEDPMPFIHSLEEQYSTGFLSVPCVGAGTANTEFEIMTGLNLDFFGPGEYPYQTVLKNMTCESLAYIFGKLGYTSHAIHNNSAHFYDRHTVFSQLGYNTFTSIEYMNDITYTENAWAEDKVLIPCILDALHDTEGKDYIYTISVQAHGAYPEQPLLENPQIKVNFMDETGMTIEGTTNAFTYYVNQLKEMDDFVRELVSKLEKEEEPCVLVMYGDHLPTIGIKEENMTEGNMFQTKYVIWNNFGMERQERDVEAYQLGALVLQDINISEGILFRYHQNYFEKQPSDNTEYLDKMAMLGYDLLYGEQSAYGEQGAYAPTKLQMGIHPVRISSVLYDEATQVLTVTGKNFTEASVVVVNGKQYEPISWSTTELVVEKIAPNNDARVCVAQMDDYSKTILSTTVYFRTVLGSAQ